MCRILSAAVILAATTVLAQDTSLVRHKQPLPGKSGVSSVAARTATSVPTPATLRERVQDMDVTLTKMHAVLRQMRAKAASSSKDPIARANLDMWELLVGHLDKQLQDLRVAMALREDMEVRRAAMYKQAEAKADAAAQAARREASKAPAPASATQGAAGTIPAGAGKTPTPAANPSPSPN